MIYSLNGELIHTDPSCAVIECGGVGYRCAVSLTTLSQLPAVGKHVRLRTYMAVREDAVDLFGFANESEMECFKKLISVNGVGPKLALALLSDLSPERLIIAIVSGDDKQLCKTSGVGKKIAQRIVLELKEKLGSVSSDNPMIEKLSTAAQGVGGARSEAAAALVMLGYSQSEAAVALSSCDDDMSVEQMIKHGLKQLSKQVM